MINILMVGCNGKMGRVITKLASSGYDARVAAGVDISAAPDQSYPVYTDFTAVDTPVDVIIDFSHPSNLDALLALAKSKKLPLVLATTGQSEEQKQKIRDAASVIPLFWSANMSLGVNIVIDAVKKIARALENGFDIEIIEKHHNQKIDAPSGTALAIADAINGVLTEKHEYMYDRHSRRAKRDRNEIGIHSVRGGTIAGEHEIIFAGTDEIIEIKHTAASRDIFAHGALKAACWIHGKKPGLYNMDDMINSPA